MSTMTQMEDLIKSSSNDLEALQGILDGVKDSMEDLRKEYESGKKDVNEYNAAMLKLQRVYDQVIDAQKNLQKEQKKSEEALEKQNKKFKDVETSARRYGATLNTALSTISSMIRETNPVLSTALGSVQKLIPNLVDCLGQFQKLTKSAKAAGVEITTFGKLMKVAMSPSGILLVITAVVELISYLKKLKTATKEVADVGFESRKNLYANLASGQASFSEWEQRAGFVRRAASDMAAAIEEGADSQEEFDKFIRQWGSDLESLGLELTNANDAISVFGTNFNKYYELEQRRKELSAQTKTASEEMTKAVNAENQALLDYDTALKNIGLERSANKEHDKNYLGWITADGEEIHDYNEAYLKLIGKDFEALVEITKKFDNEVNVSWNEQKRVGNEKRNAIYKDYQEFYALLESLPIKPYGYGNKKEEEKPEIDVTPRIEIDWNAFNKSFEEALKDIESATDAEVLKLLGFASENLSFEDYNTVLEQVLGITEERKKATEQAFKDIVQGIATDGLDEEMNSIAEGLMNAQNAQIEAERSIYNARLENYSNFLSSYADLTDSISGMISDNLDAELEAGKISEAEYKRRTSVLKAFQISSIVANTASGIVDVWKAYATERIGNAEAAVATGPAAPATLAALNAKSLTSAILQTATLSAAGVAGIASVRSGNLSGTSVTPSAGISSTPTITYTQNQGSNQDVVDAVNQVAINTAQQQVVLVVDDLNKVQSNATKVSVQSSF